MTEDKKQEELSDEQLEKVSGGDGYMAPAGTLYDPNPDPNAPSDFAQQSGLGSSASSFTLDPNKRP